MYNSHRPTLFEVKRYFESTLFCFCRTQCIIEYFFSFIIVFSYALKIAAEVPAVATDPAAPIAAQIIGIKIGAMPPFINRMFLLVLTPSLEFIKRSSFFPCL